MINSHNSQYTIQNTKKGAALLLALLITGTIGGLILLVSRISLIKVRTATNLTQSQIAYFAAQAGIEQGLMAYRANKNLEYPTDTDIPIPTNDSINYMRYDVKNYTPTGLNAPKIVTNSTQPEKSDIPYYDLKIYYKKNASAADPISFDLEKDDIKQFAVQNFSSNVINIKWKAENSLELGILEYTTILPGNQITKQTFPQNDPGGDNQAASGDISVPFGPISGNDTGILQLRYLSSSPDASAKIEISSSGNPFDSGTTYIESIGYFGQVKRKLVAEIDRQNGSLINIFDFTLYANENIQ